MAASTSGAGGVVALASTAEERQQRHGGATDAGCEEAATGEPLLGLDAGLRRFDFHSGCSFRDVHP